MINFSTTNLDGFKSVTAVVNGIVQMANNQSHTNFPEILRLLEAGDPSVANLFSPREVIQRKLTALSERVSVENDAILFDGSPVHSVLTDKILSLYDAGVEDWKPLILFWEKLESNPSPHSREQLFEWLMRHKFTIEPDGNFAAYKGVDYADGEYLSSKSGKGTVSYNGVITVYDHSRLPNKPGSVLTMPRVDVDGDANVGCSTGLHVANWRYAKDWSNTTLHVSVNPRDVVSVPVDYTAMEKVRVCRYAVVGPVDKPFDEEILLEMPVVNPVADYKTW